MARSTRSTRVSRAAVPAAAGPALTRVLFAGGSNVWINALPTAEVTGVGTVMTPTWTSDTNVNIEGGNIWPSATSAWGTIGAEALEQITETSVR